MGGAATSANVSNPTFLVVDTSGNVYFVDAYNNRIRFISAATGNISTVAGNGNPAFSGDGGPATSAAINSPSGLALDSSGNLYFCDTGNNRIRQVAVATGIITTIAGNGTAGYTGRWERRHQAPR